MSPGRRGDTGQSEEAKASLCVLRVASPRAPSKGPPRGPPPAARPLLRAGFVLRSPCRGATRFPPSPSPPPKSASPPPSSHKGALRPGLPGGLSHGPCESGGSRGSPAALLSPSPAKVRRTGPARLAPAARRLSGPLGSSQLFDRDHVLFCSKGFLTASRLCPSPAPFLRLFPGSSSSSGRNP